MRDIVEIIYKRTLNLQYKNQSSDSKNQVIHKLQEAFSKQWSMRSVRLAIEKTYNKKKNHIKGIITKHVFLYYVFKITNFFFFLYLLPCQFLKKLCFLFFRIIFKIKKEKHGIINTHQ